MAHLYEEGGKVIEDCSKQVYLCIYNQTASHTDEDQLGIRGVYDTIWKICKLPRKSCALDGIMSKGSLYKVIF